MSIKTKGYLLDGVERFLEQHPEKRLKQKPPLEKSHPVHYYTSHGRVRRAVTSHLLAPRGGVMAAIQSLGETGLVREPRLDAEAPRLGILFPGNRGFMKSLKRGMQPRAEGITVKKKYPKHIDPELDALPDPDDIQKMPGKDRRGFE